MAQKTAIDLLREIVGAYEGLVNVEIAHGSNRPDLYDAVRGALSDRIEEARAMLKSAPKAPAGKY